MSEHTPGPWEIGAEYMVCKLDQLIVGSNHIQAKNNRESEEADARLIAAAPDLLEAAEIIEDRDYMDNSGDMAKLRRAIAKAKGEQG